MKKIRVVSVGLGPIGASAARLALSKHSIDVVGAVDPHPDKAGKDLGFVLGLPESGVVISEQAEETYRRCRPDAIIHCTSSFIPKVVEQLEAAAKFGVNVVSSSEELLVPDYRHPQLAERLHQAAVEGGATILGTGVNPGFAMDFLAVTASAICFSVGSVNCTRVVDAGTRRLPLQQKVGAGLTLEQFKAREEAGGFGHIGMEESVVLVGRALGFELDRVEQSLRAVVAEEQFTTPFLTVKPGCVAGIHNIGKGWKNGRCLVNLDLTMAVGADQPRDEIVLEGEPPVNLVFKGGIPGDQATAAILVNSLHQTVRAEAGLKTVLELPPPRLAL